MTRFSTIDDILRWEHGLDDDGRYWFAVDLAKALLSDSALLRGLITAAWAAGLESEIRKVIEEHARSGR